MVRVRFAPSPTGSLHLGNALSAVANRRFADDHAGTLLLRIDDTDPARNVEGGTEAVLADLDWLGIRWDEGPVHQSSRFVRHREAAHLVGEPDADGALRFGQATLLRADGTPTYQLATAVDDLDFEITHVIRGSDHRANAELQSELIRALGGEPPEYVHHGLLLGEDGGKLSKRHGASSLADLRDAGIPPRRCGRTSRSWGCRATTSTSTSRGCAGSRSRRWRRSPTTSSPRASACPCRSCPCCEGRVTSPRHGRTPRRCWNRPRFPSTRRRRCRASASSSRAGSTGTPPCAS